MAVTLTDFENLDERSSAEPADQMATRRGITTGRMSMSTLFESVFAWPSQFTLEFRNPNTGTTPQFNWIIATGDTGYLEFDNLTGDNATLVAALRLSDRVRISGNILTVSGNTVVSGRRRVAGTWDDTPSFVDETDYRLRFSIHHPVSVAHKADTDLQNIDDDLSEDEKVVVRSRIGVAAGEDGHALTFRGLLMPDATTGILRDATEADWHVVYPQLAWNGHTFVRAARDVESQTTRDVDTVDWNEEDGLASNQSFRGFHSHNSNVQNPQTGDVYVNLADVEWRFRYLVGWQHWEGPHVDPYLWVGFFQTRALMEAHFSAEDQLAAYQNTSGNWRIKKCTNIDEGDTVYRYFWTDAFGSNSTEGLLDVLADFGKNVRHDIGFTAATNSEFTGWKTDGTNIGISGVAGRVGHPPTLIPDDEIIAFGFRPDNIIVPADQQNRYLLYVDTDDDDKYDGKTLIVGTEEYTLEYASRVASDDVAVFRTTETVNALNDGMNTMNVESSEARQHPALAAWVWNATQGLAVHAEEQEAVSGKADTDLQNIDEDLTDAQKQIVRTRLGITEGDGSGGGTGDGVPAALGGQTIETLFDNRADTETAITVNPGTGQALLSADIALSRALVAADDAQDIRADFIYTQDGQIRSFDITLNAGAFRNFEANNIGTGSLAPTGGYHIFSVVDGRANRTLSSLFGRAGILVRGSVATGDVARLYLNTTSNSAVAITEMRGRVELVPRIDALTVSGGNGSSEQQSVTGGRILRQRAVVAGDTLIAANNFGFDLAGDGQIALGRYALNPLPRTDIFDFVATVRVGGRGGNPIRLSREQFDYVGEYDLQDTWPFGGTGGGSWGNVSEIPCAMLYVNHRAEGVTKPQFKPQRQQINWSISGTDAATVILFFFSYNTSGQVDFVEMVVFTDQVVEIEGIHFHYWEDA